MKPRILLLILTVATMMPAELAGSADVAPGFSLTDIDGADFALADYQGKVVLLDFFATWCGPCVSEIPHLKALHEEYGEGLVIISISVSPTSDTVAKLQEFRQEYAIPWIIARDTGGINGEYNVQYIPTLVIIDQAGDIRYRHVGLTEESVLQNEIEGIIPEFHTLAPLALVLAALATVLIAWKRRVPTTRAPNF
jgi:thiol-disulfide isomerase/thioredoxin